MRRILFPLAVAAMLPGCGGAADQPASANRVEAPAPAAPTPPAAPPSPAAAASVTETRTDAYALTYSYPAAAAAIAPLRTWLDRDRETQRAAFAREAADAQREAAGGAFPFRPYEMEAKWQVVTDTPRFLSLSQTLYQYTGGAHGMTTFRSVVWDRERGARLAPADIFASADALRDAARPAFCRALEEARAERRPEPFGDTLADFTRCPDMGEATLILGSGDRRAIDRIGFLIEPYVAGPYAEGSYDLTVPVTPAILRAVRPEYRAAFAAR